jgi:hypothetical protein
MAGRQAGKVAGSREQPGELAGYLVEVGCPLLLIATA